MKLNYCTWRMKRNYGPKTGGAFVQIFCSGKAMNITHSEGVFVALGIQHAMRMRHIVICGLSGSTVCFHINFINGTSYEKKVTAHKMFVLIFSTKFSCNNSHSKKNSVTCDLKCIWIV